MRRVFCSLVALAAVAVALVGTSALTAAAPVASAAPLHPSFLCARTKMIEVEDPGYTQPDAYGVQIKVGLNVLADINSTRTNLTYCGSLRGITKIVQQCIPAPIENVVTVVRRWIQGDPNNPYILGTGQGQSHDCTTDTNGATWSDTGWIATPATHVYCGNGNTIDARGVGTNIGSGASTTNTWCY